jgi:hypothetical protein
MEVYYDPDTWTWDREVVGNLAIQKFKDVCNEQKAKFLDLTGTMFLDDEADIDYKERVELGEGMMQYYFKEVAPIKDKGFKPVKVEVKFMVAIQNPLTGEEAIWCKCDECWDKWKAHPGYVEWRTNCEDLYRQDNLGASLSEATHEALYRQERWLGLPVVYAGRCDMLAIDELGNYWIYDWKTAAQIREDKDFLYLDDQVGSYVWALRKIGINVIGFVYVEMKKGFPMPPKQNKNRRLGRMFSVAQNQDTDYEHYVRTVMFEDADAFEQGLYDDYLNYLREEGTVFHRRSEVTKTQDEFEELEINIGLEALEMINPNLAMYPNPGRFSCKTCAFFEPCVEKNTRGDYKFLLDTMFDVKEHYYVRQDASTDTKGGE